MGLLPFMETPFGTFPHVHSYLEGRFIHAPAEAPHMPHRQSQPQWHREADQVGWAPDAEDVVDVLKARGETWDVHGMRDFP